MVLSIKNLILEFARDILNTIGALNQNTMFGLITQSAKRDPSTICYVFLLKITNRPTSKATKSSFLIGLVIINQPIRRTIMTTHISLSLQLWQNLLRQSLAQLHTPLIKRINAPNGALSKNLHLIQRNQNAQHTRCEFLKQHGSGGTIPIKDLVWDQCLDFLVGHGALKFGSDGFGGFTKGHGLGLGKVVREEDWMMIGGAVEILDYVVLGFDWSKEVTGDDFGALVDELVEGMLPILEE